MSDPDVAVTASDVLAAQARLRPHLAATPVHHAERFGCWLKLENLQRTGSYKVRGALNALLAAREVYRAVRARRLERTLAMLEWREKFAKTRRDVVHLIHQGDLAADSWVGTSLYLTSSSMVRRATSYQSFTRALVIEALRELPKDDEITKRVRREIKQLSPDAREVFLRFLDDWHSLVYSYSWLYRAVVWISTHRPVQAAEASRQPRRTQWKPLDRRATAYRTANHLRRLAAA